MHKTRKTLIHGTNARCCNSEIISRSESVLITAPLPYVEIPDMYPAWASVELTAVLKILAGCQLLLSRSTARMFQLHLSNEDSWELDSDFIWWLFMDWLQNEHTYPEHLVVGASVIRQTGILLALTSLIGIPLPKKIYCLLIITVMHGNSICL
ncbi:MAG: hypothetical protein JKX80_00185 [Candidatus Pacebacteria bacterium]|nr:hypothetical protein [Candidatus Paceibacterota bacterium]